MRATIISNHYTCIDNKVGYGNISYRKSIHIAYYSRKCYLAITCHVLGFLKDAPFVQLCKLFGRKVVIHQHNKGMSGCIERWPYRWLIPYIYKRTRVILLSWYLYPDIEKAVRREQVVICPNGIPETENGKLAHR